MKIQAVSYYSVNSKPNFCQTNCIPQKPAAKKDVFRPSFGGYSSAFENIAEAYIKSETEVEKSFDKLFRYIMHDSQILWKPGSYEFMRIYQKGGFRGLMHELWTANTDKSIAPLINKAAKGDLILAKKDDKPILSILNLGRQGFLNTIFDNQNAPREVILTLNSSNSKKYIEFSLNKKGGYRICQRRSDELVTTTFHPETGNRKIVAILPDDGNPKSIYYKKDGSPDGLKNFLYGESATSAMAQSF